MENELAKCACESANIEALLASLLVESDGSSYTPPLPAPRPILERYGLCKISDDKPAGVSPQSLVGARVHVGRSDGTALALSPPTTTSPTNTPNTTPPARLHVPANSNLPAYRYLSEDEKIGAALDGLEAQQAFAFRLTFSPAKDQKLRQAARDGRDILQAIGDELTRQFRRHGFQKPAFAFSLEIQPGDGLLHIHGALLPAEGGFAFDRDLLRSILTAAGGGAVYDGHGSGNGVWLGVEPIYTPRTWFAYARKDERRVLRRLGIDRVVFMNDVARRIGKQHHNKRRDQSKITDHSKNVSSKQILNIPNREEMNHNPSAALICEQKGNILQTTEIYIPDGVYDDLAGQLTQFLNFRHDTLDERRAVVFFTLWQWGGLDLGEPRIHNGILKADRYTDLVEELATIRPGQWGGDRFDRKMIAYVLGEVGDIWPERIRPAELDLAA